MDKIQRREVRIQGGEILLRLAIFFGTLVILMTTVFGVSEVTSNDMAPALRSHDRVLFYRNADYSPTDVIIYERDGVVYTGRIAAMRGSVIGTTEDGEVTIDGRFEPIQPSEGIYAETYWEDTDDVTYPMTLGEDEIFILADRRDDATDSRRLGPIRHEEIKGKIISIWRSGTI